MIVFFCLFCPKNIVNLSFVRDDGTVGTWPFDWVEPNLQHRYYVNDQTARHKAFDAFLHHIATRIGLRQTSAWLCTGRAGDRKITELTTLVRRVHNYEYVHVWDTASHKIYKTAALIKAAIASVASAVAAVAAAKAAIAAKPVEAAKAANAVPNAKHELPNANATPTPTPNPNANPTANTDTNTHHIPNDPQAPGTHTRTCS